MLVSHAPISREIALIPHAKEMLRILLIDDNPDDRLLAVRQLSRMFPNLDIQEITDNKGFEAALAGGNFDLTVTDYQLRWTDGITILRSIKERYADCPVVMFTNTGSEEIAVEAMKAGLSDYVLKLPKYYSRLPTAVQLAWERTQDQRRAARLEKYRQALSDASQDFAESTLEFAAVLDIVSRWLGELFGDLSIIGLQSDDGQWIKPASVYHPNSKTLAFVREFLDAQEHRVDEGIVGRVMQTGEPLLLPKVSPEDLPALINWNNQSSVDSFRVESMLLTPLQVRSRIIGIVLLMRDRAGHPYTHDDQIFLQDLANRAAVAIDNARLYRDAQEANRLKDEFLATLSHELRTPLNSMLGWASLLRNHQALDKATLHRALEVIERNAKAQVKLIEDLLDVSRIIRGKLSLNISEVDLIPIIEEAINIVRPAAIAKSIQIESVLDPSFRMVWGDADRLGQVIWNLLSNAVKFTPDGGFIGVRLSGVILNGEDRPSSIPNYAEIEVSDTGMGINPEFLPFVFHRFRQADSSTTRSQGGLGLGLAIVRHLVELHGGVVQVTSAGIGQGTTFTVKLPLLLKENQTVQEDAGPRKVTSISSKEDKASTLPITALLTGLQVLLVDDNSDTLDLITTVLQEYGAKVKAISSVAAALEILSSEEIDVLVSDLGMPQEDGYDLITQWRNFEANTGNRIPAIALTAFATDEDSRQAIAAGFDLHLSKPVDLAKLVAAVASLTKDRETV